MTEEEMAEIYERLLGLTKDRKIQWKSEFGNYSVSFSHSTARVGVDSLEGMKSAVEVVFLDILNDQGRLVSYAAAEDLGRDRDVKYFKFDPSPLLTAVIDNYYRYSETSESILDELRKIETRETGNRLTAR